MEMFQRAASSQLIYAATEPWRMYGGIQRKNMQILKNIMNVHLRAPDSEPSTAQPESVDLPQSNEPESKLES